MDAHDSLTKQLKLIKLSPLVTINIILLRLTTAVNSGVMWEPSLALVPAWTAHEELQPQQTTAPSLLSGVQQI